MYSCIFSLIVPENVEQFLWKPATYIYDLKKLRYSKSLQNDKIHFCKVQQMDTIVQVTISDRFEVILHTVRKSQIVSKNSIFRKNNEIVNLNFRAKIQSITVIMIH